jgi:hypothetical protein
VSLFDWLLISHLFGDFVVQTDNMANRKLGEWRWMLAHIGVYMVSVTVILVRYALVHGLPGWLVLLALLFIAGTHVILDRRRFVERWMRLVRVSPRHPWLPVIVDQVFHLVTLAIVAQCFVIVGS